MIQAKCETTENPQTNSILEIINQVVANFVNMFDFQNKYLEKDDTWSGILAGMDFSFHRV